MRTKKTTKTVQERDDWPLWWFNILEKAIERGDYAKAAEANENLERLGYVVRYRVSGNA